MAVFFSAVIAGVGNPLVDQRRNSREKAKGKRGRRRKIGTHGEVKKR